MEKIISIEEWEEGTGFSLMEGYKITTDKQEVKLLVDGYQQCCEDFGYFLTEDDTSDFIGAELVDIKITDKELKEGSLKSCDIDVDHEYFEGGVIFVDIVTSQGVLQFVAYNEHNGYYGHEAKIISTQLNLEEVL